MSLLLDGTLFKAMVKPIGKRVNEAIEAIVQFGEQIGKTAKNGNRTFKINSWGYDYFASVDKKGNGLKLTRKKVFPDNAVRIDSVTLQPGRVLDYKIKDKVSTNIKPGQFVERIIENYKSNEIIPDAAQVKRYNFKTGRTTVKNLSV